MKKLFEVEIPKLSGEKLIKDSGLFSWIDDDFVNYGAIEKGIRTEKQKLEVMELTENMDFASMFDKKQALTQEQILYFVENHKDKLTYDGYATFFLLKSGENFFVARVYLLSDGRLDVDVYKFGYAYVWRAGRRDRVVVPQLTLGNSSYSGAKTLNIFDPSKIEFVYDGKHYKLTEI